MFNLMPARSFLTSYFLAAPHVHILQNYPRTTSWKHKNNPSPTKGKDEAEQPGLFYDSTKIRIPLQH